MILLSLCLSVTQASELSVKNVLSDDTIETYLKLYLLLYADDTVIFAESSSHLQLALNSMSEYCKLWKLTVNSSKTKVFVFSRGKCRNIPTFYLDSDELERVDDFSYLGIKFNYNGKFIKTMKYLCGQARKAMFSVLKKSRNLCLDLDLQIHLFDSMICPILLYMYGSEVWGIENTSIISSFHLQYIRLVLNMRKSTSNVMLYGELGILPIEHIIKSRVIHFWCHIISDKSCKISNILYRLMLRLHEQNVIHSQYIDFVQTSLNNLEFSDVWLQQSVNSVKIFVELLKKRLKDQFNQSWSANVFNSNKCTIFRIFKNSCHGLLKIIGIFYLNILLYNSVDLGVATINCQLKKI